MIEDLKDIYIYLCAWPVSKEDYPDSSGSSALDMLKEHGEVVSMQMGVMDHRIWGERKAIEFTFADGYKDYFELFSNAAAISELYDKDSK